MIIILFAGPKWGSDFKDLEKNTLLDNDAKPKATL